MDYYKKYIKYKTKYLELKKQLGGLRTDWTREPWLKRTQVVDGKHIIWTYLFKEIKKPSDFPYIKEIPDDIFARPAPARNEYPKVVITHDGIKYSYSPILDQFYRNDVINTTFDDNIKSVLRKEWNNKILYDIQQKHNIHITIPILQKDHPDIHVSGTFGEKKMYYYPKIRTFSVEGGVIDVPEDIKRILISSWEDYEDV